MNNWKDLMDVPPADWDVIAGVMDDDITEGSLAIPVESPTKNPTTAPTKNPTTAPTTCSCTLCQSFAYI